MGAQVNVLRVAFKLQYLQLFHLKILLALSSFPLSKMNFTQSESPSALHCNPNASAFDWTTLFIATITTNITWWASDITKIWKSGWGLYLKIILWHCVRLHMPAVTMILVLKSGHDRRDFPKQYYYGFNSTKSLGAIEYAKLLVQELFTIAGAIMSLYQACQWKGSPSVRYIDPSTYIFPTLPATIIGLSFLIFSRTKGLSNGVVGFSILFLLIIFGTANALILRYIPTYGDNGIWYISTFLYVYMALPLGLCPPLAPFAIIFAIFARVGGVSLGALIPGNQFPVCQLKRIGFGVPYLSLGILAGLLGMAGVSFAVCGI